MKRRDAKKKKWMRVDEAIARIMHSTGCSHEEAVDRLAGHMQRGEIGYQKFVRKQKITALAPEEAARRFQDEPEAMAMSMGDFARHFMLRPEELLGELQSGRLLARPRDDQVLLAATLAMASGGVIDAEGFLVTGKAICDWLFNPATPRHLIERRSKH